MRLHGALISGSLEKAGFLSAFVSNIFSLFSSSFFHVHCQFRTTCSRVPKIYLFIGPRNVRLSMFPEKLEYFQRSSSEARNTKAFHTAAYIV